MSPVSFQNDVEYEQPVFFQNDIEFESCPAEDSQKEKSNVTFAKLTVENFASLYPAVYNQLRQKFIAEGKRIERQKFELLKKACGNDARLLGESLLSEDVAAEVLTRAADKLEAENKQMAGKLEDIEELKSIENLTEQQLRDCYAGSQDLQDEFHDIEAYIAYVHEVKKDRT